MDIFSLIRGEVKMFLWKLPIVYIDLWYIFLITATKMYLHFLF